MLLAILLTRVTDWLVLRTQGIPSQTALMTLSEDQIAWFFTVSGAIKFIALLAVMTLSVYSKFFREELTGNFTHKPGDASVER